MALPMSKQNPYCSPEAVEAPGCSSSCEASADAGERRRVFEVLLCVLVGFVDVVVVNVGFPLLPLPIREALLRVMLAVSNALHGFL